MDRRTFLVGSASALSFLAARKAEAASGKGKSPAPAPAPAPAAAVPAAAATPNFTLPELPYKEDALAPVISALTVSIHHGKHHRAYVDNLNNFAAGTEFAAMKLEDVIKATNGGDKMAIFNNAAQVAHHTFYWKSMKPAGGGTPPAGPLLDMIVKGWGSFEKFRTDFIDDSSRLFGSGWCWLVLEGDSLKIAKTSNAALPPGKALLVIDVWEHAYYLDYQNRRKEYVVGWFDKLANWDFAAENLKA